MLVSDADIRTKYYLKWPGDKPSFLLKALYMAERDLNPESVPIPSIYR